MEGNDVAVTSDPPRDPMCVNDENSRVENGSNNDKVEIYDNDGKESVCEDIMENIGSENKCEKPSYKAVLTKTLVQFFLETTCF